ncbi:MAG TPA: FliM/FliN family flagellar motor switch protein [Planctomycetota bacterium]|nr:FliM/FliN family flagellar motor switch protein [Planctomycetota bacterium]
MAARGSGAMPDPTAVLAATAQGLAEELARALEAACGRPVKCGSPATAGLSAAEVGARLSGPGAGFCIELGGSLAGRMAFIFSGPGTPELAALLAGTAGAAGTEEEKDAARELADADLEVMAGPLSGALVGMAEKLAAQAGSTPGMGLGDAMLVRPGAAEPLCDLLGRGPYPSAGFQLEVEGLPAVSTLVVFPAQFEADEAAGYGGAGSAGGASPEGGGDAGGGDPVLLGLHPNVRRILGLRLQVSVLVAEKQMDFESVLKLNPGTILEFDKSADEHLDLMIGDQKIGSGDVVIVGERFGIQLRQVEGLEQRIRRMGSGRR